MYELRTVNSFYVRGRAWDEVKPAPVFTENDTIETRAFLRCRNCGFRTNSYSVISPDPNEDSNKHDCDEEKIKSVMEL